MRQRHNRPRTTDYNRGGDTQNKVKCEKEWIEEEITLDAIDKIDRWCKNKLSDDKTGISNSQIRKFYGEVRRIQTNGVVNERTGLKLLKPKLAYAVGRDKGNKSLKEFYDFMSDAVSYIDIAKSDETMLKKRFSNFVDLFEAIVAYHKFHDGKN